MARGGWSIWHARRQRFRNKRKYLGSSVLAIVFSLTVLAVARLASDTYVSPGGTGERALLSEDDKCHAELFPYSYQDYWVVSIFEAIGVIYCFIGLAIVCDDYFTASLQAISDALGLSEDVAGATFMAAGSSAPELFTSVASSFTEGNPTGVGTIIGSAVFNINVIIGATAIFAGQVLQLDWRPLTRDCIGYALTIIVLLLIFSTGNLLVDWYEAACFLVMYAAYVLYMKFNPRMMALCPTEQERQEADLQKREAELESKLEETKAAAKRDSAGPGGGGDGANGVHDDDFLSEESTGWSIFSSNSSFSDSEAVPLPASAGADDASKDKDEKNHEDDDDDEESGPCGKFFAVIAFPLAMAFKVTIPNCEEERWEKWFAVTFFSSILWIGMLSHFMVGWATYLGCIVRMPQIVMGLTVLAAGTSIPDALGSISVAKEGQGDMAIANAIGSNIFDILIGLGSPWVILNISRGRPVAIDNNGIEVYISILFGQLIFLVALIAGRKWKIDKISGGILLVLYVFYFGFSLMTAFPCASDPVIYLGSGERSAC